MIFIDKYDNSFLNKLVCSGCLLGTIFFVLWLMFSGYLIIGTWFGKYHLDGDFLRNVLISICLITYFVRLQFTIWKFQKRKLAWTETVTVVISMSIVLFIFGWVGGNNNQEVGIIEIIGILLFLFGSFINTKAEYSRYIWKQKSENKGQLYAKGLFKWSMHINYFGDVVLFTGVSLVTNRFGTLIIPLLMALNFIFFIIPSLDRYLAMKYKDEFNEYSKTTKKFIPFIY